jgi:hypothetical protein
MIKKLFGWYLLPLKIMIRPFAGFYEMKFENKGTLKVALFNFLLVSISYSFSSQYSSILVNPRHPASLNSLYDFLFLTAAMLLFCISNWSVTSLTDGEGKFRDIIMAVCYAMTPLVLTIAPAAIISNFLSGDETGLYFLLLSAGMFYFVLLVFAGLVTVHNYGAVKALLTVLLTFAAIVIIVFLLTLLFTLWQQLWGFAYSVYTELMFRT